MLILVILIVHQSYLSNTEKIARMETTYLKSPNNTSDTQLLHNETLSFENFSNDSLPLDIQNMDHMYSLPCPPGFNKISDNINKYCYQISAASSWDYPCLKSGGATVITELSEEETNILLGSLYSSGYKQFWLPARRQKLFTPILWYIPGPNWGRVLSTTSNNILPFRPSLLKNCVMVDVEQKILKTDTCSKVYPSLCFYINDLKFSAICPKGYHAFRYILDYGSCFGIEESDHDSTIEEFINTKCEKPMGNDVNQEMRKFIFSKIAELSHLPSDSWCWFSAYKDKLIDPYVNNISLYAEINSSASFATAINKVGTVSFMNLSSSLPCMACEAEMVYSEAELIIEYNSIDNIMYLTVYFPSGLWKYNSEDRGVQCFSDAKGFSKVIDMDEILPYLEVRSVPVNNTQNVEKNVYAIHLITERSARYWCEGHTNNFSLVTTEKIVVNPQGNKVHVFSLVLKVFIIFTDSDDTIENLNELSNNMTQIFKAEKVLVMDVLDYNMDLIEILLHLHMPINDTHKDSSQNIIDGYNFLLQRIETYFPQYNYTLVNISSSIYCLPTISKDSIYLDWELTPIGHIASPKQFCLQANGLPVNRQCHGSYLLGSVWGNIEGQCDRNYEPSNTTTFLFNFVQGNVDQALVSRFLTVGLQYVFGDVDIIIPADIYYLSVSFQHILNVAGNNLYHLDTGDIDNIAWVMDRITVLDNNNLRLAQTLNSSNVILDSITNIIDMIARKKSISYTRNAIEKSYQIATQPNFIVQISYPIFNNITGIAIINTAFSENFTEMDIRPLFKNTSLMEVISIPNLEVASWFPQHALMKLKKNFNESDIEDMRIVINVYNNDAIFQQLYGNNKHVEGSRIIEIAVPNFSTISDFKIPLVFRNTDASSLKSCGFWDFKSDSTNIPGSWSSRECYMKANINNLTICECYHLTHFGQLLFIRDPTNDSFDRDHHEALNIITLTGSFLSLIGIIGIWITALVFDTWRRKAGTKVLLQLSAAIAIPLVLIIVFNLDKNIISERHGRHQVEIHMKLLCIVLGATFHYAVLANFMWMLLTAILQFIRYVRVLGVSRPSRFMIKLMIVGWGVPLLPVIIVLLINYENYIPNPSYGSSICYPTGNYMIFGVVLPVCIILLINIIIFIMVIKSISTKTDMRVTDKNLVCAQFRVSIFLFFLLGLTWIFGIASFNGSLAWSYLFCLTSTTQGFVLFIYFVLCDPSTRNLWITIIKPQFSSSRNSITTVSNG